MRSSPLRQIRLVAEKENIVAFWVLEHSSPGSLGMNYLVRGDRRNGLLQMKQGKS